MRLWDTPLIILDLVLSLLVKLSGRHLTSFWSRIHTAQTSAPWRAQGETNPPSTLGGSELSCVICHVFDKENVDDEWWISCVPRFSFLISCFFAYIDVPDFSSSCSGDVSQLCRCYRSKLSSGSSELLHKWAHTDLAVVAGQAVTCCPAGWATARWAERNDLCTSSLLMKL